MREVRLTWLPTTPYFIRYGRADIADHDLAGMEPYAHIQLEAGDLAGARH